MTLYILFFTFLQQSQIINQTLLELSCARDSSNTLTVCPLLMCPIGRFCFETHQVWKPTKKTRFIHRAARGMRRGWSRNRDHPIFLFLNTIEHMRVPFLFFRVKKFRPPFLIIFQHLVLIRLCSTIQRRAQTWTV